MPNQPQQNQIKPAIVLVVCLAVVAIMFAGSILIGYAALQTERETPSTQQSAP